jgi:hypothetical protein
LASHVLLDVLSIIDKQLDEECQEQRGARAATSPARRAIMNRTRFAGSACGLPSHGAFARIRRRWEADVFRMKNPHSSCDQAWPGWAEKAGYACFSSAVDGLSLGWVSASEPK